LRSQKKGSQGTSKKYQKRKSVNSSKKKSHKESSCQSGNCGCQKSNRVNKINRRDKITLEREPFVFDLRVKGESYPNIATAFEKEYNVPIDPSGIFRHLKDNPRFEAFAKEFYGNIKAIPIANASCRIEKLRNMADRLEDKIMEITDLPPKQWEGFNLSGLLREWRGMIEQIQEEAGDKHKEGQGQSQPIQIFNYIPGVLQDVRSDAVPREATSNRLSGN
jgi:hypothetical protein